jgi:isocitrate dehydrogenase
LTFQDQSTKEIITIDQRELRDRVNAIVTYDNPYDNVEQMAHHFFQRCLDAKVTPYVVCPALLLFSCLLLFPALSLTLAPPPNSVFKWQESFWKIMKQVFDKNYKTKFRELGLLSKSNGELCQFLSDVATMHVIRWSDGDWGMCSHNYDGDVLTDEIAQVLSLPPPSPSNPRLSRDECRRFTTVRAS